MGVKYVGGNPTRITSYKTRKNTDRWMHEKEKKPKTSIKDNILFTAVGVEIIIAVIVFTIAYFA